MQIRSNNPVLVCRTEIRSILADIGLPQHQYLGHSFQTGTATSAAFTGIEDSIIQTLGCWLSAAFLQYIRKLKEQLVMVSVHYQLSLSELVSLTSKYCPSYGNNGIIKTLASPHMLHYVEAFACSATIITVDLFVCQFPTHTGYLPYLHLSCGLGDCQLPYKRPPPWTRLSLT